MAIVWILEFWSCCGVGFGFGGKVLAKVRSSRPPPPAAITTKAGTFLERSSVQAMRCILRRVSR